MPPAETRLGSTSQRLRRWPESQLYPNTTEAGVFQQPVKAYSTRAARNRNSRIALDHSNRTQPWSAAAAASSGSDIPLTFKVG
jgi:hypothetical protein